MDDEIDIREYLQPLVAHWRLILSLGLLAAAIVAGIKLIVPPTYQAEALVSVASAHYSLSLEGAASVQPVPLRAYPDLALSSDVVNTVFLQFKDKLPAGVATLSQFRRLLAVAPAADPTLLQLTVKDRDPQQAADIANAWAAAFTANAGELFSQDQANVRDYEQQLGQAKDTVTAADNALAAFQAGNQVNILTAELDSQQAVLADSLNREQQLALLIGDTQDLLGRLDKLSPAAPSNSAEDLALLSIMTRVFSSQMVGPGSTTTSTVAALPQPLLQFQVQVGTGRPLVGPTVADQHALAEDLLSTLQARRNGVEGEVQAIQPKILALQERLAQAQVSEVQLTRTRDLAADQYRILAGTVEQAKIALGESANIVQVASHAAVPTEKSGFGLLATAGTAGAIGLALVAALVLFVDYWRKGESRSNPAPTNSASAADSAAPAESTQSV